MKNNIVNFEYQRKEGRNYVTEFVCEDAARTPLYNGFDRITVTYDHGGRRVYTVSSH